MCVTPFQRTANRGTRFIDCMMYGYVLLQISQLILQIYFRGHVVFQRLLCFLQEQIIKVSLQVVNIIRRNKNFKITIRAARVCYRRHNRKHFRSETVIHNAEAEMRQSSQSLGYFDMIGVNRAFSSFKFNFRGRQNEPHVLTSMKVGLL